GTRYMPIPILLPAGLSRVIGDTLVSEKLLIYLSAVATFGLVFWILRRRGCPRLVALALVAGVLATGTGLLPSVSIHWDTAALFLQLAALAVVDRRKDRRALVVAGILCSLALMSKISALWGPAAIGLWLLIRHRRALWVFVASYVGSALALFGIFE